MSDQSVGKDPGRLWRDQPVEVRPVNIEQIMNRRTEALYSASRLEILVSISAAVLLVGIVAWRLVEIAHERLLEFGFAAVIAWVAISLYCFRSRLLRRGATPPDEVAVTGLQYYRKELERRRDHLRNGWLWYGPLCLASSILIAVLTGRANLAAQPLRRVLPLLVLLAVWAAFGFWRRHLQARELQREINEMEPLGREDQSSG